MTSTVKLFILSYQDILKKTHYPITVEASVACSLADPHRRDDRLAWPRVRPFVSPGCSVYRTHTHRRCGRRGPRQLCS